LLAALLRLPGAVEGLRLLRALLVLLVLLERARPPADTAETAAAAAAAAGKLAREDALVRCRDGEASCCCSC
jgi:hypothetical protein